MSRGKRNKAGRGRGSRGRGRGSRGGGDGQRTFQDTRLSFDQIDKTNEKFERYYNTIGILPRGPERDSFWAVLRTELPNSFRFTGSRGHALSVRDNLINRFFPLIQKIEHEGRAVELPKRMPWYPDGLAYSMTTPKSVIRKYEPFKEFQRFLVSETGVGNISRQEEVSMIPPLLLDVEPHHTVLDLCAAPGSKSAQLIELIHAGEEERVARAIRESRNKVADSVITNDKTSTDDAGRSTGILIANDSNYRRAHMLVHQVKRLNSPNLIVMNHDATMFPSVELPVQSNPSLPKRGKYLKFDRILADVPCSGDGTCRKNPSIWKDWQPQNGLGLYITQVRILTRALQMLKVGGRVVYSTCSMNPVENEAVVASAIERCGGVAKVRLVDPSGRLPELVRSPGLIDWSIMSREGKMYESWAEAQQYESDGSRIVPGMFPPVAEEEIPLQYCMRVYPHHQNTGGFFIAALEKQGEIKAKPEGESKSGSKTWAFEKQEASGATAFTELLAEATQGSGDSPTKNPDLSNGAVTAAQRQNSPGENNGVKRVADEDNAGEQSTKRMKMDEEEPSLDTGRREHWPPPPRVVEAIEAAAGVPGSQIVSQSRRGGDEVPGNHDLDDLQHPVSDMPAGDLTQPGPRRRRGDDGASEEAFKYLDPSHPDLLAIYDFYNVHRTFPRDRFLVRNPTGDPVKGIYYSSQLAKEILTANEKRGMKFVHAGVKMFMKQDSQGQDICRWRIQTEGLAVIQGWVEDRRVVNLSRKSTLRKLLVEMFPKITTTKLANGEESGGWKELGEIGERVRDIGMGCCLLRVQATPDPDEDGFSEPITLPLWRSLHSLNLMLPKEDRRAMLLRIYNEDVELINHSDPRQSTSAADRLNATLGNGSVPAETLAASQSDERDENDDQSEVTREDAMLDAGANDEGEDQLDALAMEQDALAAQDRVQSQRMAVLEDENRKIAEAMPERAGEGDDYNTTV